VRRSRFVTVLNSTAAAWPLAAHSQVYRGLCTLCCLWRRSWHQLVRSALQVIGKSPSVRVIIYGEHGWDWMTALAPQAPVWNSMYDVAEVLLIPATRGVLLLNPAAGTSALSSFRC
jgi:hypothetical protein